MRTFTMRALLALFLLLTAPAHAQIDTARTLAFCTESSAFGQTFGEPSSYAWPLQGYPPFTSTTAELDRDRVYAVTAHALMPSLRRAMAAMQRLAEAASADPRFVIREGDPEVEMTFYTSPDPYRGLAVTITSEDAMLVMRCASLSHAPADTFAPTTPP